MKINLVELKNGKQIYNGDGSPLIGEPANNGLYALHSEYLNKIYFVRISDILIIEAIPEGKSLEEIIKGLESELDMNQVVDDFVCQVI